MNIILIFFIAVSLSMDAFSLSLAYGTVSFSKKDTKLLSIIVGLYHFFMPILGILLGNFISKSVHIGAHIGGDVVTLIIFSLIGINMIIESTKEQEEVNKMKIGEMILFGFAVSIDSFSVGIGLNNISDNFLLCSLIFSLTSAIFTYLGLILGKKLNMLVGKLSTLLGGIALIVLGVVYVI